MNSMLYDKEYMILDQIDRTPEVSQRDLSSYTGLSLGSVNILLKKMAKEGLLKIESIPAHRVMYMLTPKGMLEKANKTMSYMKLHYKAIEETKQSIAGFIGRNMEECGVQVFTEDNEMETLLKQAIHQLSYLGVGYEAKIFFCNTIALLNPNQSVLVFTRKDFDLLQGKNRLLRVICFGRKNTKESNADLASETLL